MDIVTLVATVVTIVVGVTTLILQWPNLKPKLSDWLRRARVVIPPMPSRRKALIGGSIGFAGIVAYLVVPRIICTLGIGNGCPRPANNLVKNRTSGVIHELEACKGHLPKRQVTVFEHELLSSNSVHASKYVHIAGLFAQNSDSEPFILSAIERSPTSTHLYKHLVKKWGREKQYEKIHALLEAGISRVKSLQASNIEDERRQRQYKKALEELEQRKTMAEFRASLSAI